jgi:hypothetical protein
VRPKPLLRVVSDERWPTMWRVEFPDGRLSDMVNLARARDAARTFAMRGLAPSHDSRLLHWKQDHGESRAEALPARQKARRVSDTHSARRSRLSIGRGRMIH